MAAFKAAYVTLLTNESYLPASLVLNQTLVSVGSKYPLVIMATPLLSATARKILTDRGITIRDVDSLLPDERADALASYEKRFRDTWTKLRAFDLSEYDRVVMIDSDMIVMRNMDDLFDVELLDGWIAAAHACACNPRKLAHYPVDWIPENCAYTPLVHPAALTNPTVITSTSPKPYSLLNSGTVLLKPSHELFEQITHFLATSPLIPTFSFPDQDLLAEFFRGKWKPLPWYYNALKTLRVIHKPLWRDEEVRCLHYILHDKPWHQRVLDDGDYAELNEWWWAKFEKVKEEMIHEGDEEGWKIVESNVAAY